VGAFPTHITYSEFAIMHPNARTYLAPAIAMGQGSELIITTPRGYNHAHKLWEYAKASPEWFTSLKTAYDTDVLSEEMLREEAATMPEELFRQEYLCDWSAANVGSILGRYIEAAERDGRIGHFPYDPELPIYLSSDIGFRDTSAWWEWQVRPDGFAVVGYDADTGLDADDWIERLRRRDRSYEQIWLPHDAKAKTFATKKSALERFQAAFGVKRVAIVPQLSKADRINAGRIVARQCRFDRDACGEGMDGLREWSFKYNEDTRAFSREPDHNWASHPGDGYSYGAQMVRELKAPQIQQPIVPEGAVTIEQWIKQSERPQRRARI